MELLATLMRPMLAGALLLGTFASFASAADEKKNDTEKPGEKVSYFRDVVPIMREHCQGCHQPAKRGGELLLTTFAGLKKGGESGAPGFVAGKPDQSLLIEQITPEDGEAEMPKKKPPLDADQIALIRRWISEGAKDDTPINNAVAFDADHPPKYNAAPLITSLDYSPDGKLLAVSGYHEVLLHKADGSGLVARLVGLSERIEKVAFSPDGKFLAVTGGSPARMGELQIWNVEKRELMLSHTVTYDTIYGASWAPDGSKIAFGGSDNVLRAIDVKTGKQVLRMGSHSDWVLDTVFSVKGTHLISVGRDRSMKLTVVATQRFEDNITSITPGALKGGLAAVDRHPTKDELLCGGADGTPKVYRMIRKKARKIGDDFNRIRTFEKLPGRLFTVRYSRDGNRIVAGSSSNGTGEVRVFDANNGKRIAVMQGQAGAVYATAFSPDGKVVASGGFDGAVRLNDAATGKLIKQFVPVKVEPQVTAAK